LADLPSKIKNMSTSILFSDTPEHFYEQPREYIQQTIQQELSTLKKEDSDVYLKKQEVCSMQRYLSLPLTAMLPMVIIKSTI
jgi:hypothetical protein